MGGGLLPPVWADNVHPLVLAKRTPRLQPPCTRMYQYGEEEDRKEECKRKRECKLQIEAQRRKELEEQRRRRENRRERRTRLANGTSLVLYHQTNATAAAEIKKSGRMMRGNGGTAGGGIYFATNKPDTTRKAMRNGYMVHAKVQLGKVKTISSNGDPLINFQSLLDEGFDSVLIPRLSGTEYVVYNFDQVEVLKVRRKKWTSKW